MGQIQRPVQQEVGSGGHADPHGVLVTGDDRGSDRWPEHLVTDPGADPGHDRRFAGHPVIGGRISPQVTVRIAERLVLHAHGSEVYLVVGNRAATGVLQQPSPPNRTEDVGRAQYPGHIGWAPFRLHRRTVLPASPHRRVHTIHIADRLCSVTVGRGKRPMWRGGTR